MFSLPVQTPSRLYSSGKGLIIFTIGVEIMLVYTGRLRFDEPEFILRYKI